MNSTYQVNPGFHATTQLQYNLDALAIGSLESKFRSPSAILIQHLGRPEPSPLDSRKHDPRSPIKYSHLSHNKLSQAMRLAKEDVKLAKRHKALSEFAKENGINLPDNKIKKSEQKLKQPVYLNNKTNKQTFNQVYVVNANQKSALCERPKKSPRISSYQTSEIGGLRLEIENYVDTIRKIFLKAKDVAPADVDPQEKARLMLKHIERSRKLTRTLYNLQNQVQTTKMETENVRSKRSKKSETVNRLAAAHRGTIRLLRTFASSLPEQLVLQSDLDTLHYNYTEVSKLLRELSLCSLQLGFADVSSVDCLMQRLDEIGQIDLKSEKAEKQSISPQKNRKSPTPMVKKPSAKKSAFSRGFITPIRKPGFIPNSVKSGKQPIIKKEMIVSSTPIDPTHDDDVFNRPAWKPPSRSPSKDVAPLGGLGSVEYPKGHDFGAKQRKVTKNLRFEEINKEHDIDSMPVSTPVPMHDKNLRQLKEDLSKELEKQVEKKIGPLVQKVEKLTESQTVEEKSAKQIDLGDVIVDKLLKDAAKDMIRNQQDDWMSEQAGVVQNTPTIATILKQLEKMENVENEIRQKWQEINYGMDVETNNENNSKPDSNNLQPIEPLGNPQPFNFTKNIQAKKIPKVIVRFTEEDYELKYEPEDEPKVVQQHCCELSISDDAIEAIQRHCDDFKRHLRSSFHESKAGFNPWKIVEEVSDDIVKELLSSVESELDDLCSDFATSLYQSEFLSQSAD